MLVWSIHNYNFYESELEFTEYFSDFDENTSYNWTSICNYKFLIFIRKFDIRVSNL